MARRSDHSREELAALVIAAARDLVQEGGLAALSMRGVAQRAGYAVGSIYNAVGDIDELLLKVNTQTLTSLGDRLLAVLTDHDGQRPVARAIALADAYMAFVAGHAQLWAALLERPLREGMDGLDAYLQQRSRLVDLVSSAIAPLYPDAAVRRRAVVTLWASLQGIASLAASGTLEFALEGMTAGDLARSLVQRYLSGSEAD